MSTVYNPYKLFHGSFIPEWLEERPTKEISLGAKLIFARLSRYCGKNGKCFPKIEEISKSTGINKRQVERFIAELKKLKLIKTIRIGKKCANRYQFLKHPWMMQYMDCDTTNTSYHSKSDTTDPADPMDTTDPADPQKENQGRESSSFINNTEVRKNRGKQHGGKKMTIKYKSDQTEHCRFMHPDKKITDPGAHCLNPSQEEILVQDENGKKSKMVVCPRHERIATRNKTFRQLGKTYTVLKKDDDSV